MTASLSIAFYVTWLATAFGIRTYLHLRRTGDTGWRGISEQAGSAQWWGGVLFVVALVIGFVAPVAELRGLNRMIEWSPNTIMGICLALAGIGATLGAQSSMRDSWRIGVDANELTTLRTDGAFSIVRNPIFSAMLTTAAGLALMTPNVIAVGGLACLLAAVQLQVRVVEEPYLRNVHRAAFTSYERAVGRFTPWTGRLRD